MNHPLIISCGIFRAELEYLAREKRLEPEVLFLDAALHVNFDRLKARLVQALEENARAGRSVSVLYGNCHPEMLKIMGRYGARKIKAVNCIEAIVGREEMLKMQAEGKSFYLTAGWINNWEAMFAAGSADLKLDFRSLFSDYKRVILFDTGVIPIDEARAAAFSTFTGLPIERRKIGLDNLLALIRSVL